MSVNGQSKWVDISCFFAHGVSEADLKAMLPANIVMENGFVCPAEGKWSNNELASIFTAIMGLQAKQLDNAPANQDFFDCLLDNFMCSWFASRFDCGRVPANGLASGSISFSVPAGGSHKVNWDYNGAGDNPTVDGSNPQTIFLNNNDNAVSGGDSLQVAGGQTITINQGANVRGYMTWDSVRVDC